MYNWNDLRHFLAVVRGGSMSKAAHELKVDQSTVGRRMAALEEALGARLVDRTAEGVQLTETGRRILDVARRAEDVLLDLDRRARGHDDTLSGVVRIATSESFAIAWLLQTLRAIRAQHPQLALELVTGNEAVNLIRREADIAVRMGPKPRQQHLVAQRLGTMKWALYAAQAYLRTQPVRRRPLDLSGHAVLGMGKELEALDQAQWLRRVMGVKDYALRCNSMGTLAAACAQGWGVAVLPWSIAQTYEGLVRIPTQQPVPSKALWLVVHEDLRHIRRIRAVMDGLVQSAKKAQKRLLG